jgi:hypothetical protein
MEAIVWLFREIGGLLAIAGFVFFGIGWWLKGKTEPVKTKVTPAPAEPARSGPSLAELAWDAEKQHWEEQATELRAERDALLAEVSGLRARSEAPAPTPKPAKPRPRKTKK